MKHELQKDNQALTLTYKSPAPDDYKGWEQWSLPIGNGGIGASIFGGINTDHIHLNEKSLWSGGPSDSRPDYMGGNLEKQGKNGDTVKKIQQLFAEGRTDEAGSFCGQLVGLYDEEGIRGYGYYLSYGNLSLHFNDHTEADVTGYSRYLDLSSAIAGVEYEIGCTHYKREYFVSYPDNILVARIIADGKDRLNLDIKIIPDNKEGGGPNHPAPESYEREWNTVVRNNTLFIQGKLKDNGMKFCSVTKVFHEGGTILDEEEKVTVADAKTVTVITSIGTDYANDYPHYRTGESAEELCLRIQRYVEFAAEKSYEQLKENHIQDYETVFNRVSLELGQSMTDKTTDALLAAYKKGSMEEGERKYLEVLLFQYGRYLLIESSRETPDGNMFRQTLPANLQGIWTGGNNSAWHCDYHMNVNLQMNYWPAYSANMAECARPLIDYVDSLRKPGRVTAAIYAGVESNEEHPENGFIAHTQNNPFGWTCPGWSFDWGWSPAAVPWILQNCWEYYKYTGDKEYLQNKIYPMMKEEALFYDQILVEDKEGFLVSSPSYSPEHGPRTAGNTYEQTLIWQLYEDTVQAAEILGLDRDKRRRWRENQHNLKGPVEIGESGQIKEWYEETTVNSLGEGYVHRHLSHMLGLFPGTLISEEQPEVFKAARKSMENRTDESTGWGMGQRMSTWARLGDGNKAYKLLTDLIQGGIMENLWDTHPPFQIDGNFGLTAGIAEMLLQSNGDVINLLPALPDVWVDGRVKGLVARGNYIVDMVWTHKKLIRADILSRNGGRITIKVKHSRFLTARESTGGDADVIVAGSGKVTFDTSAGVRYVILNDFHGAESLCP